MQIKIVKSGQQESLKELPAVRLFFIHIVNIFCVRHGKLANLVPMPGVFRTPFFPEVCPFVPVRYPLAGQTTGDG